MNKYFFWVFYLAKTNSTFIKLNDYDWTKVLKKKLNCNNAIRLIKNYNLTDELLTLVTSNFYSVLYYNSEVWHLKTLHQSMKNKLLSISSKALKLCTKKPDMWMLSFNSLHEMVGRATPDKIFDYKLALQLYKAVNNNVPTPDWINNFNRKFNRCAINFR